MIIPWHPLDAPRSTTAAPEPTERQQARRRAYARTLYLNAANQSSWRLADRMARAWGLSAESLGVPAPIEPKK